MTPTLIAGYDGTEASRAAVRFVTSLASRVGASVIAAHVSPAVPRAIGRGASVASDRALRAEIHADAEELMAGLGVESVDRLVIEARSPAAGLHHLAGRYQAELLAIGATHHGWLGRVIPGTVGHHLLHGAPCPVAVIPAAEPAQLATIAVGYDGGDEAKGALRYAAGLAERAGARLLLLGAATARGDAALTGVGDWLVAPDTVEGILAGAAAELETDVTVESRVLHAPTGAALVDACRSGVDVLVLGSRDFGPVRSVIAGSVSRYVADHATCPVIVVPRGVAASADAGADAAQAVHA